MKKKLLFTSPLLCLALLAAPAFAATLLYYDGPDMGHYGVPENWTDDNLPSDNTEIAVHEASGLTVLHDETDGSNQAWEIRIDGPKNLEPPILDISSGTLNTGNHFRIANDPGTHAVLYMSGGTINAGLDMIVGNNGDGEMYMSGGTINVTRAFEVCGDLNLNPPGNPTSYMEMTGGTINASQFFMHEGPRNPSMKMGGDAQINTQGDETGKINDYISRGLLTATDPNDFYVVTEYDGATTTVKVAPLPKKAYNPSPGYGSVITNADPNLGWENGIFAESSDVYFGTDYETILNADTADPNFRLNTTDNDVDVSALPGITTPLPLDRIYYWRIDERNAANPESPWIGDVWEFYLSSGVPGQENLWEGPLGTADWDVPENWELDRVPNMYNNDIPKNRMPGATIAIVDGIDAVTNDNRELRIGSQFGHQDGIAALDMSGGTLSVGWHMRIGNDPDLDGEFYMSGGTLTIREKDLIVGNNGRGYMKMTGGQVIIQNGQLGLHVGSSFGGSQPTGTVFDGLLDIWGGTIEVQSINVGFGINIADNKDGYIDIRDTGTIILPGDRTANIESLVQAGRLYSWNGRGEVLSSYDSEAGTTTITASAFDPLVAHSPDPIDGATNVSSLLANISWAAGDEAAQHDVYFGTDYNAVLNADTATTGIYRGRQAATSWPLPDLELGQTYYWRIDEYNNDTSITTGAVWSFTTASFLLIDDFDSYADLIALNDAWNSASATLGLLTGDGLDNSQAMEVSYLTDVNNAQVWKDLSPAFNIQNTPMEAIAVRVFGDSTNQSQPFYVALEDGVNRAQVPAADPNVTEAYWMEYNFNLQDFRDAGVNLTQVTKFEIGFPQSGNPGTVRIDNIYLYPPRCLKGVGPVSDLNGDCFTNMDELAAIASEWLIDRSDLVLPAPLAYWAFDETTGLTAQDASGNNRHAQVNGAQWQPAAGKIGGALRFGGPDYVLADNVLDSVTDQVTIACWVYGDPQTQPQTDYIFDGAQAPNVIRGHVPYGDGRIIFHAGGTSPVPDFDELDPQGTPAQYEGNWNHWTFVKDAAAGIMRIYLNGELFAEATGMTRTMEGNSSLSIGARNEDGNRIYNFDGWIDEFRVYDVALTPEQVKALALQTDYDNDQDVDIDDLSQIVSDWLSQILWP